jgi:hypothetical protein
LKLPTGVPWTRDSESVPVTPAVPVAGPGSWAGQTQSEPPPGPGPPLSESGTGNHHRDRVSESESLGLSAGPGRQQPGPPRAVAGGGPGPAQCPGPLSARSRSAQCPGPPPAAGRPGPEPEPASCQPDSECAAGDGAAGAAPLYHRLCGCGQWQPIATRVTDSDSDSVRPASFRYHDAWHCSDPPSPPGVAAAAGHFVSPPENGYKSPCREVSCSVCSDLVLQYRKQYAGKSFIKGA